jgi:hypothetical protein
VTAEAQSGLVSECCCAGEGVEGGDWVRWNNGAPSGCVDLLTCGPVDTHHPHTQEELHFGAPEADGRAGAPSPLAACFLRPGLCLVTASHRPITAAAPLFLQSVFCA